MATNASRKQRGRITERLYADYLKTHGFPYAEPVGSSAPGADITGTPGIQFEVKARRGLELPAWLRQADGHGINLPVLVVRPDGAGAATIGSWAAITTVDDMLGLLREARYTDGNEPT